MPDEVHLREQARAVVQAGKLLVQRAVQNRTWGGPGVGAPCTVCEKPVGKDEMEFEIEFARDGDNSGLDKFHVHVHIHCFALALAWAVSTALLWPSPWRFVFPGLGGFAFLACVVGWLVLGRYALLEHAEEQLEQLPSSMRCPYDALYAFLQEHHLCRPGLDEPDITDTVLALWCSCTARITVTLPPLPVSGAQRPMPQRRNVELVVRDGDGKLVYRLTLPRDPIEDTAYLAALVGGQEVSAIACDRPVTSAAQASGSDGRS